MRYIANQLRTVYIRLAGARPVTTAVARQAVVYKRSSKREIDYAVYTAFIIDPPWYTP